MAKVDVVDAERRGTRLPGPRLSSGLTPMIWSAVTGFPVPSKREEERRSSARSLATGRPAHSSDANGPEAGGSHSGNGRLRRADPDDAHRSAAAAAATAATVSTSSAAAPGAAGPTSADQSGHSGTQAST